MVAPSVEAKSQHASDVHWASVTLVRELTSCPQNLSLLIHSTVGKSSDRKWPKFMYHCRNGASRVCLTGPKINILADYLELYRCRLIINTEERISWNDVWRKVQRWVSLVQPCCTERIITCNWAKPSFVLFVLPLWHIQGNTEKSNNEQILYQQGTSSMGFNQTKHCSWAATNGSSSI